MFLQDKKLPWILLVVVFMAAGVVVWIVSPAPSSQPQVAQPQSIKPLRGLIGILQAVDEKQSTITVTSKEGSQSYPVSNDVLISQITLGVKSEEMKQVSIPTQMLSLADLQKKKGEEVYLVFDQNGQHVTQIQMYTKK